MIELPRAALTADQIAEEAEFFSFGTNDLTQTTYGISRDDINNFLPAYFKYGIFKQDPFATLDQAGVGLLVKMATAKGRNTRPNLKVGICGEHGGDPESVKFCHKIGLNYVSCSPFRLLTARLAAAQAALEEKHDGHTSTPPARQPTVSTPRAQPNGCALGAFKGAYIPCFLHWTLRNPPQCPERRSCNLLHLNKWKVLVNPVAHELPPIFPT